MSNVQKEMKSSEEKIAEINNILGNVNILVEERWTQYLQMSLDKSIWKFQTDFAGNSGLSILDETFDIDLASLGIVRDSRPIYFRDIDEALLEKVSDGELTKNDLDEWRNFILSEYAMKGYDSFQWIR